MAASLISFPVFTRILSVSDYGILDLITATIALTTLFSKLGLQNSIIRFYPKFANRQEDNSLDYFYSTIVVSIIVVSFLIYIVFIIINKVIIGDFLGKEVAQYLSFASIIIIFAAVSETLSQFFRAEQRTRLYNFLLITARYARFTLSIFFFFFIIKGIYGLLFGRIIAGAGLCITFIYLIRKARIISPRYYSFSIFTESILYGLPLIFTELSHIILSFGDRYLIQYFLGPKHLGLYSAGYNFSMCMAVILTVPLRDAIIPLYMDIWTRKGETETKMFLSKTFKYYTLVAIPSLFGFILVSKELLSLLASARYTAAYIIVPYVVIGYTIYGSYSFFASGLMIRKKTLLLSTMLAASCTVNILLNIWLIPKHGLLGAAVATLIAYTVYILLIIIWAVKNFMFQIEYKSILLYCIFSGIMAIAVRSINLQNLVATVTMKILIGIAIYSTLIMIFDGEIRAKFYEVVEKFVLIISKRSVKEKP